MEEREKKKLVEWFLGKKKYRNSCMNIDRNEIKKLVFLRKQIDRENRLR